MMTRLPVSRRGLLRAAGVAAPLGLIGSRGFAGNRLAMPSGLAAPPICKAATVPVTVVSDQRRLKLTWNATAVCTVGVPVAQTKGYFTKRNLDVELINFGGSTDQLLEAIASGKADAGVGMALRWLKPLEQGFDVRITTALHGGCMRLLAAPGSGITKLDDLKGKTIGVADLGSPDKNFFAIRLAKLGLDPLTDVEWKVFPADLLPVTLKKGEIQAFTAGDPLAWVLRERDNLTEVANNLDGEYAHRTCCVLGVRGSLICDDRPAAAAVTEAILEAQDFVFHNPDEAAALFAPYAPSAKPEQLAAMLRSHTHGLHPIGADLRQEIALYVDELKAISVIKQSTNSENFQRRCTPMSSASSLRVEGSYADFPPIEETRAGFWFVGLAAAVTWGLAAIVTQALPDIDDFERTDLLARIAGGIAILLLIGTVAEKLFRVTIPVKLREAGAWLVLISIVLTAWELVTAKYTVLPRPFFASPQALLEVFTDDYPRLGDSVWHSVLLLAGGYAIGAAAGFVFGVAVGWWRSVGYWAHPVLRLIGPLPATAWLPLAFFAFPSSHSASTFLIALATGFPVTVLTWSGVAGVNKAYYDVARTMGASQRFLVLKVAIPAAMPSVFVGLFMGLGASFSVLVVAEMMGVKSGLGWYLQWAQGWAAYANMYAALLVMALMCTGLITLLFRLRDRLLAWQKGLVQW